MQSVKDRVVLVTGANRGIGKSIVEEFLRAGAGKIYAAARNPESIKPLSDAYGDRIAPLHIDMNEPGSIAVAAKQAADVGIVINNAGMLNIANPLASNAVAAMQDEMEVNVYGLMRMAQAFAPILKANGGGAFVQLNSVASMKNFADFATYSASKAASYSITQGLRDVLQEQGTQVISVHPGPIATDMANSAGLGEIAEPAELVAQAIIDALESGEFHAFPDTMAKQIGAVYRDFASNIVEANLMEG
ncbi:MAG: short-chain dehydrogenase [gamma proteobacterium symbiont of Ctena orbiculata]|uniref:SDR family oxidoreductase n=1 Tax=Candidatus Thiodiazotropha sp. CDECU1 TaxID=3065865 RepID=UPI000D57D026|nr:SDR family oxidoreductase [Candidatus Thiodiazotropha sp. CDECU1]PVV07405.1 MAG: short-chain dehydrogenase [gamma proteobacterium symbiont of Ctena orbiculata]PVV24230.1 MAG: short-chain dehydrogenase [gamma proteobacterium symbiont of Ctena orbiculata]PVV24690.1 MAG: short-chain dehydrogenase [gamma proteobacterium symbiont of Ctena orbiculata]